MVKAEPSTRMQSSNSIDDTIYIHLIFLVTLLNPIPSLGLGSLFA